MRRIFILIAVGFLVTIGAVVIVSRHFTRDDSSIDRSQTTHSQVGNLQNGERHLICDFGLDPDDGLPGLWAIASQACSLETGWSRPVRRGVSISSHLATMKVFLVRVDWTQMAIRIWGQSEPTGSGHVEIRLNDSLLGETEITVGWQIVNFSIPSGWLRREANEISLTVVGFEPHGGDEQGERKSITAFLVRRVALTTPFGSEVLSDEELRSLMDEPVSSSPSEAYQFVEPEAGRLTHQDPDRRSTKKSGNGSPDIVLITLDAARPDHFSCYGYHRLTTPNIDRLARESLVFNNVFAEVPNTRQSVPTMVTGLSFVSHGVTAETSMLAEEASTLAEYLKGVGYRTACFTATPNNSSSIGTDQGYDEFVELWSEVSKTESFDPHLLARRAVEWLKSNGDRSPIHLQLHFVPPHAPYLPKPEFDLFTEPGYDGPFTGFPDSILWGDERRRAPTGYDLAHLIASYDGNLRAADDAVSRVLSALQARRNWDNTIVLVTSDHGEAFFEHRHLGHNSTVYDEMLRVPFILRLPTGFEVSVFDPDRLATLADIVPTLLATTSVNSPIRLDGIDLLAQPEPARESDERVFAIQTAHRSPTRGLRSSRWKIIISNSGRGQLFDLTNDPHELSDLKNVQRAAYLEKGQLLVRRFMSGPMYPQTLQEIDLPDRDREMLEALGYGD